MNRLWVICVFGLIHAFVFMVLYDGAYPDQTDVKYDRPIYFSHASKVVDGQLPYRDFDIEFTPLGIAAFSAPRLVANTYSEYHVAFSLEMLLFDLIGLWLIILLASRLDSAPWKALVGYTLFLLTTGPIVAGEFDIVPAVMVLFSLYAFLRGWNLASWIALGLGTMTKIYPIVVIPIFAIYLLSQKDYRRLAQGGVAFAATVILISLPCIIISPSGFYDSFAYHAERGIQVESTYSSLILLGDVWGLDSPSMVFEYGAIEVHSSIAGTIARLTPAVMLLALGAIYFSYARKRRHFLRQTRGPNADVVIYATLAIIVFMLANKVFSPQYAIWIYPLIPLIVMRRRFFVWALYIGVGLLTLYIFPDNYQRLLAIEPKLVYALVLRNVLLLGIALLLWRGSQKQPGMASCESRL